MVDIDLDTVDIAHTVLDTAEGMGMAVDILEVMEVMAVMEDMVHTGTSIKVASQ